MILNNTANYEAVFKVTSYNGRETDVTVGDNLFNDVDLTQYESPFSVQVVIAGSSPDVVNGLDENYWPQVSPDGNWVSCTVYTHTNTVFAKPLPDFVE